MKRVFRFPDTRQYVLEVDNFAQAAQGGDARVKATLENSVANQRVIDALFVSKRTVDGARFLKERHSRHGQRGLLAALSDGLILSVAQHAVAHDEFAAHHACDDRPAGDRNALIGRVVGAVMQCDCVIVSSRFGSHIAMSASEPTAIVPFFG